MADTKKKINAASFVSGAKSISDVTDKWCGKSPSDLADGLVSTDLPEVDIKTLIDKPITVLGYQERTGKVGEKDTEYLICLAVPAGQDYAVIFLTGGEVILRKLRQANTENALPVSGKIISRKGASGSKFTYYDFVS
jgi:hypothetical protein